MNVNIKALTTFDHGQLSAHTGGTYTVKKGDADELVKAGLAQMADADAPAEDQGQDQRADEPQVAQPGDAVVDGPDGELKASQTLDNKMEGDALNKATRTRKKGE